MDFLTKRRISITKLSIYKTDHHPSLEFTYLRTSQTKAKEKWEYSVVNYTYILNERRLDTSNNTSARTYDVTIYSWKLNLFPKGKLKGSFNSSYNSTGSKKNYKIGRM